MRCAPSCATGLTLTYFQSPQITAESIRGRFRQVLNNTNFVDADGSLTLGTLTFNQFGPKDLKVHTVRASGQLSACAAWLILL